MNLTAIRLTNLQVRRRILPNWKERIMRKVIGLLSTSALLVALASTNALAWGNCGHGYHRNSWSRCVSNYGRTSGCPSGYHLGWNVHACVPNR